MRKIEQINTNIRAYRWSVSIMGMPIPATISYLLWKYGTIEWPTIIIALSVFLIIFLTGRIIFNRLRFDKGILSSVGLISAIILSLATGWLASRQILWSVLITAIPIGLMSTASLRRDNSRLKATFWFELITPYAIIGILSMTGTLPIYTSILFTTIPVAIACARTNQITDECGEEITDDMQQRTSVLSMLFSIMLIISFIIAWLTDIM